MTTLGQLIANGVAELQTGPFGTMLQASEYQHTGIPVVAVQHIGDNRILHQGLPKVAPETESRLARYKLAPGDIVFGRKGAVDRRALIRAEENGWLQGSDCIRLRLQGEATDPFFISYLLGTSPYRNWIVQHAHGATMPSLNQEILRLVPLALPPIAEQREIARFLNLFDDKIELNRSMNKTLEATARALFKSWFVDFDPVRAKAAGRRTSTCTAFMHLFSDRLQESSIGKIPAGWRMSSLGVEARRCGGQIQTGPFGSQLHASDYVSGRGVPVVMPKNILNRRVSTREIALVTEADAERLSRYRLKAGDIVYSRRGDVERHAWISSNEAGWLCGTGCLLVRMGSKWTAPLFISFALDRPESKAWIAQRAIGATMPNLNTSILSEFPVAVPPDTILSAFATLADPLELLVSAKNAENKTLAELRDTLLPKLISGDLRLRELDGIAEATKA
jgi:type I restriction enzyme S subunit